MPVCSSWWSCPADRGYRELRSSCRKAELLAGWAYSRAGSCPWFLFNSCSSSAWLISAWVFCTSALKIWDESETPMIFSSSLLPSKACRLVRFSLAFRILTNELFTLDCNSANASSTVWGCPLLDNLLSELVSSPCDKPFLRSSALWLVGDENGLIWHVPVVGE